METLDIARWQFAITTIYHFLLVPITIGLSFLVALMQTKWHRTGEERYLRIALATQLPFAAVVDDEFRAHVARAFGASGT